MRAQHERPGPLARYCFYMAGRVPRGHERWAARRLEDVRRWNRIHFAMEMLTRGVFVAALWVASPPSFWAGLALCFLLVPFSARNARARAGRVLAATPADMAEPVR